MDGILQTAAGSWGVTSRSHVGILSHIKDGVCTFYVELIKQVCVFGWQWSFWRNSSFALGSMSWCWSLFYMIDIIFEFSQSAERIHKQIHSAKWWRKDWNYSLAYATCYIFISRFYFQLIQVRWTSPRVDTMFHWWTHHRQHSEIQAVTHSRLTSADCAAVLWAPNLDDFN